MQETDHPLDAALGREFLLWLWYRFEDQGGLFELPEFGRVGVALDSMLELAGDPTGSKTILRGDSPTRLPEAGAALLAGKEPERARLILAFGSRSFELTLDAPTFNLLSVKCVAGEDEAESSDPLDRARERASALFELSDILDALYLRYLEVRLDPAFENEMVPKIRDWIVRRRREATALQKVVGA